jgi:hypothetical protein
MSRAKGQQRADQNGPLFSRAKLGGEKPLR